MNPAKAPHFTLHTLIWILAFHMMGLHALAQPSNWNPQDYYGIPERDKQSAFLEEFEDNRHGWDLGTVHLSERIGDGDYYLGNLSPHGYPKYRHVPINRSSDYEVEVRMRFIKGSYQNPSGLVFGQDVRGNEYGFLFNGKGLFKITKNFRGRTYDLIDWTDAASLARHSYNTLTVRRVKGHWYYFINYQPVAEMPAHELFGDGFGFTIGGHMAMEVDYFRVAGLRTLDLNGPQLTILEPALDAGRHIKLTDRRQIIRGRVSDLSGVREVTINDQVITVSSEGGFSASISLPIGATAITIEARDTYDNRSQEQFVLEYVATPEPLLPTPFAATPGAGKNYLLIIGVNEYVSWNRLHNAVKDCQDLATTLTTYYQFEPEQVISLFNEEATRENILETLENLQKRIQAHDNLLIYYAGHGYYDEESGLGYWVPVNARLNKIPDFIRNSTIHDYLRTIRSKNTLLIADACYAGSLFAVSRGPLNENAKSRWAFTSGNIEKVWDGQPGQNSPFARYLLRVLRNNTSSRLYANDLIDMVGDLVQSNTAQNPQGSPLRQVGDDGGVFVFERRQR